MKKYFAILSFFLLTGELFAQTQYHTFELYEDWWKPEGISRNRDFLKLPIVENGVYRVMYDTIIAKGLPIDNHGEMRLYRRGQEVPLYVELGSDNIFNSGDYIEFYAEKNDGELDSLLYQPRRTHPHNYYSLYTDSAAYFLTTTSGFFGARVSGFPTNSTLTENFHIQEHLKLFTDSYARGIILNGDDPSMTVPSYDRGEGWFSNSFDNEYEFEIDNINNIYSGADSFNLEIMVVGADNKSNVNIEFYTKNSTSGTYSLQGSTKISEYRDTIAKMKLNYSDFDVINNKIYVKIKSNINKSIRVAYTKIRFPQNVILSSDNEDYIIPAQNSAGINSKFNIQNSATNLIVYDITNSIAMKRANLVSSSGNATLHFTHQPQPLLFYATAEANIKSIASKNIKKISIETPDTTANYIIITHSLFKNAATQYATYRSSPDGGAYRAVVYLIEDLYNIFSYGDYNSVAIRNFCDYMLSKGNPEYLFLIGKALSQGYSQNGKYYRHDRSAVTLVRNGKTLRHIDYVPTPGDPGGDNFFSSKILKDSLFNGSTYNPVKYWSPAIATGRLPVVFPEEVTYYLNKVIEYENTVDTAYWKKKILHLAGGSDASQINYFYNFLNTQKYVAEGEFFGADVSTIVKNNLNTISEISIDTEVNKGLRLITFIGHSAPDRTDLDVGYVSNPVKGYNNFGGKYPIILLNGCRSGDFFSTDKSFGEDWVMTPNKGAISFIANSTSTTVPFALEYTRKFYLTAFKDTNHIESSIGKIARTTARNFGEVADFANSNIMQIQAYGLLGDPAVLAFGSYLPDLEVRAQELFISSVDGKTVTAVSDSFNLSVVVRNHGRYNLKDSIYVSVSRNYGGTIIDYPPKRFPAVAHLDTLQFGISSSNVETFGINTFYVHIDYNSNDQIFEGQVKESNEYNNEVSYEYYFPLSAVTPLYPREFSIISEANTPQPWSLIAQSTDLLVTQKRYRFELDTTDAFNSPLKETNVITAGSLVTWENAPIIKMLQSINVADSTVFYWRVRFEDLGENEDTLWGNSSFQYIYSNPGGWSQAHPQQFKKDYFKYLKLNQNKRTWSFDTLNVTMRIQTIGPGIPYNSNPDIPYEFQINWNNQYPDYKGQDKLMGFICMVVDGTTLLYKKFPDFDNNHSASHNGYQYYFDLDNAQHRTAFLDFISQIECDDYLVLATRLSGNFVDWNAFGISASVLSDFNVQTYPTEDSVGYILISQKCSGNLPVVEKIISKTESISEAYVLSSEIYYGFVNSTIVGPSTKWMKLHHHAVKNNNDSYYMEVYGLDIAQKKDTLLFSGITPKTFDLSSVSDKSFPYMKLNMYSEDNTTRTPVQLQHWIVTHEAKIPEGTLLGEADDYSKKKFYEGQKQGYTFKFKNISKYDFVSDTLKVFISLTGERKTVQLDTLIIKSPKVGETTTFNYELNTVGLGGYYNMLINVNPKIQLEERYSNNSLLIPFDCVKDDVHPILDVTFDGVRIMNNDIISPNPHIVIKMKDENEFLLKNDTTGVDVYFYKKPDGNDYDSARTRINFSNPSVLRFNPATSKQDFSIDFRPTNLQDGIYVLEVQVQDVKGNKSGTKPYMIHCEVITKSSITHFLPYPNPFSTNMRFAYTFTGSKQPSHLKIQIMTVTGKIVREITQDEIGYLKIGKHLTDYSWDGTDEFGDHLANGVYIYQVISKIDGEEIEKRATSADDLFKKNWGKLYILR